MGEKSGADRVTSHDVATEAGVSQATVGRVFAAPEKVAPATRANVRAAAERLGYVPNAIARSLKAQRTDIIGAVVPATGEYWQHVVTTFSRQLRDRRKQLLLFSFDSSDQVPEVLETVAQYRVDGMILASASISGPHMISVAESGMPVVAFNQPAAQELVTSVTVDNVYGMAELANHLADQGAQSALFLGGAPEASTDQMRYRGAAAALGEHGIACPYHPAGDFGYEAGFASAAPLVERGLPGAVMVAGDELAFGLVDGLRVHGLEAPRDVLITGFDGLPQCRWAGYDLTTLEQPIDVLVEHAIDNLLDPPGATSVVHPGVLRVRGSTTTTTAEPPLLTRTERKS